jgi:DNA-binding NarL/FixJ family response regulator
MINIVIADAQYLVRIGLKSLLSTVQDFKVIGEAANTKELLDLISSHHTDVVIF